MTTTRTRIAMAALAAATAITGAAAVATGVAAHRADDRATAITAELDRERADRLADFKSMSELRLHKDLRDVVERHPDGEPRFVLTGSAGYAPTDTGLVERGPATAVHACPDGQVVSAADVELLAEARVWVDPEAPGVFQLPHVIDPVGVRCVPAE